MRGRIEACTGLITGAWWTVELTVRPATSKWVPSQRRDRSFAMPLEACRSVSSADQAVRSIPAMGAMGRFGGFGHPVAAIKPIRAPPTATACCIGSLAGRRNVVVDDGATLIERRRPGKTFRDAVRLARRLRHNHGGD
jgi:hypothetical protein